MLYGQECADAKPKENWKRLLLQYCELDTMAMVIIFEHWWRRTVPIFGYTGMWQASACKTRSELRDAIRAE